MSGTEGGEGKEPIVETVPAPDQQVQRHPLFGWLRGMIQVHPSTNLTQPAAPEWGERCER